MTHLLAIPLLALAACACGQAHAQDTPEHPALTQTPGDAVRGLALIRDPSSASCLICHSIAALPDRDQGELGPPLDGVAAIYDADELRQRVMDARRVSPDTIMPPYFSTEGLYSVGSQWSGRTIYSAQEVEDVVAFLVTLDE